MTRLHTEFVEPERPCAYLPGRLASHHVRLMSHVGLRDHDDLIQRGWRHQGAVYFRPVCQGCQACVCLRLPVERFTPTRSQQRARRRCGRFSIALGRPREDQERLDLYHAWHAAREQHHGWDPSPLDDESYFSQFVFPQPAAYELTFRDRGRLVAVGLHDVSPGAWSAVYFFYDPAIARLSPGVANVVLAVELARARGIPYVYLGYRVEGCAAMTYKGAFRPHELLVGRPGLDEPAWLEGDPAATDEQTTEAP